MDSFFTDRHAHINTDVDALLGDGIIEELTEEKALTESIVTIADLDTKLHPLSDDAILNFMSKLRGGTYFNMGMFSVIAPNAANKHKRIYKIMNMAAIVSGVDYENIGTTKDFRDRTGEAPGSSWYDHKAGYEHRVGVSKKSADKQYVLWKYDDKKGRSVDVWYFIVDTIAGTVDPVSLDGLLASDILTPSVKKSLMPKKVTGIDKTTGELITNDTNWRTAAFEHIFWLSQGGANPMDLGSKFLESLTNDTELTESGDFFVDRHAHINSDVDTLLSDGVVESKELKEDALGKKYIIAETIEPDIDKPEFYSFDFENCTYKVVKLTDLAADDYHKSLGDARFVANAILSMSDLHRIYILDADTMTEVDSLDYYVDYEDEDEYPGYFDESCKAKNIVHKEELQESYRRTVNRGASLLENELFVDFN